MKIKHCKTGELLEAVIELVEEEDWVIIDESDQFIFNWTSEKASIVHKIRLELEEEILGLISYQEIPKELRIHVNLVENSNKNKGKEKEYDWIAGALIARTCQIAFEKEYDGFVSLQPKTELEEHYIRKYGFRKMGQLLFTELQNSEELIIKYLDDGRS